MATIAKTKPATRYRWPAYLDEKLRQRLRVYLAKRGISFSEWVRRNAEADLSRKT